MIKARHAALALCLAPLAACSQVELLSLYFANEGSEAELSKDLPLTLPFKDVDGWITVPARVNGSEPIDFVLDTGASAIALIDGPQSRHLELDMADVHRLGAQDDLAAPFGARQDGMDIDFGGLVLKDQVALAIPQESLGCGAAERDMPFQGVIGHDLFRRYTVAVDRDRGTVTLHDPASFQYRGTGKIIPAEISGRQPFVTASFRDEAHKTYNTRLHVDSGAAIDLTLFPATMKDVRTPTSGKMHEACFVGGKARYRIGQPVTLGFGDFAAETPVEYAMGKEVIDAGQNGRIGAKFLAHYNVIFDYSRSRIILEPRAKDRAPVASAP